MAERHTLVLVLCSLHISHIIAKLVIVCFIALPLLHGYHVLQHEHECNREISEGSEEGQLTADCEVCDLYYSQIATVEKSYFYHACIVFIGSQTIFADDIDQADSTLSFLRGPPIV